MARYLTALFLSALIAGGLFAQEAEKPNKPDKASKTARILESEKEELWRSLSEEDRNKLREALRNVWTDPAVIAARDEVQQASDSYSRAVKNAISRNDPSLVGLLGKLQSGSSGIVKDKGGRPGPGFGPPRRKISDQIGMTPMLEKLTDEERKVFRETEAKAREAESVLALREELNSFREKDETLRKERIETYRKLRKALLSEMIKINPEIAELQKKVVFPSGPRPDGVMPKGGKGGSGAKGKGRPPVEE